MIGPTDPKQAGGIPGTFVEVEFLFERAPRTTVEALVQAAEGDYDGYAAGHHPDAVLVSLASGTSYPIARALAGWKQGIDDTRAGRTSAGVEFRFTRRLSDGTTAHETGMFRYFSRAAEAEPEVATVHSEALLVKKEGAWEMVMEFQKDDATEAEWEAAR